MPQETDFAARFREQEQSEEQVDFASRMRSGIPMETTVEPAPGVRNQPPPAFDPTSPGVNPFTRLRAEFLSDNPEELNAWARQNYGEDAIIMRGADIGLGDPGSPEAQSTYLSRGFDQPFELFDPTQGVAAQRADIGPLGRAAEIGAETIETSPTLATEAVIEGGLLASNALIPGGGAAVSYARNAPRVARAARAGYMAGTAATAAGTGSMLQQFAQNYAGTQRQEGSEQINQALTEAGNAAAFSGLFTGLELLGRRGVDILLGRPTREGEAALGATREFNEMVRSGAYSQEELSEIAGPLAGYYSQNPPMQGMFSYLARLAPEVNNHQREMRQAIMENAQAFADDPSRAVGEQDLMEELQAFGNRTENRLYGNLGMADTEEIGLEALAFLGNYREVSGQAVNDAYGRAQSLMLRDFGEGYDLTYDWSPVENVIRDAREMRRLDFEEAGQRGAAESTVGDQSAWNNFSRIQNFVEPILRGNRNVPPTTIIGLIENINDELANAPITDRGKTALVNLKTALNDVLDSIPEQNDGIGRDALQALRNAQAMHRDRMNTLDSAGVAAVLSTARAGDYGAIASNIYGDGAVSRLRNIRDALTGEGRVQGTPNGREEWDRLRQAYALYAIRRSGNPGNAAGAFESLNTDVRNTLFPDPNERQAFARSLRDLDSLHNNLGFREIAQYGEVTNELLDRVISTQDRRSIEIVGRTIERATQAGNEAPQRAFSAGVWQHLIDSSITRSPTGQTYLNANQFANSVDQLRRVGALDVLSEQQRQNIENVRNIIPASTFELSDSGSGLAAAQLNAALLDPGTSVGAISDLATLRLVSGGLIMSNPSIVHLITGVERGPGTDIPTAITRMAGYYTTDENQVSNEEWRRFARTARAQYLESRRTE